MDVKTIDNIVGLLANRIDSYNVTIIETETKKEKANLTIAKRELIKLKYELEQFVKRLGE
tara:strand:+ start:87 stop:266 length:180 start_codon:yes stop_codon:yes gene_type:complete